ncbi:MAG: hypothetical protein KAX60_07145, partial [Azonexus sp.]|nr:hypothetical protein [Azonexus sp.]
RGAGFLSLELPHELQRRDVGQHIEQHLAAIAGILAAAVDPNGRQLSIRFSAASLSTAQVARAVFSALNDLPPAEASRPQNTTPGLQPLLDKLKTLLTPATPPVTGSLQARFQPLVESALTEKAIINFFNDIVAFYLIRTHWDLISKRWLQHPIAHSNAWLTVFYLIFLLIRYRKNQ